MSTDKPEVEEEEDEDGESLYDYLTRMALAESDEDAENEQD